MHVARIFITMKTARTYIHIIIAGLVLLAACFLRPAAAEITPQDMFVFDLINQYRSAPFAHAVSLGYDPAVLQEKGINPETVFAPYELDQTLTEAAAAANARELSAALEPEPIPPVRRHTAQTSSAFSFSHFMPLETAAHIFVQNLFKNELETGDHQFILSEAFRYAGTSADPGVVADTQMNAWFLSLHLGSFERVTEMQMLNLINQIRANPRLTQFFIHTDATGLFQQNPQIHQLWNLQFAPVFLDDMLQHWARADAAMSGVSPPSDPAPPQTADPDQNIPVPADFHESYPGELFQTATVAAAWEDMITARPVADLFSALLYSELTTWPYGAVVFSNRYTRAGVAISLETLENTGTGIVSVYAGSLLARSLVPEDTDGLDPQPVPEEAGGQNVVPENTDARNQVPGDAESRKVRIYGLVFSDHDDDLMYSPGEDLAQQTVSVYELVQDPAVPVPVPEENPTLVKTVVTDNAGHFSLSLDPDRQWVFEAEKDGQTARRIIHIEKDQFVKMFFSPLYPLFDTTL